VQPVIWLVRFVAAQSGESARSPLQKA